MLGVLLESQARRQRRTGGAALSVAAHMAIIGAVTAATAHGKGGPPEPIKVEIVKLTPPPVAHPVEQRRTAAAPDSPHSAFRATVPVLIVAVPTIVPTTLPAIELSRGTPIDSIVIGGSGGGNRSGRPSLVDGVDDAPTGGAWTGTELMMRIINSAKPRYPEMLRQTGIDGRVLVRFTVDTLGRVDMNTVQILQSTHDLFSRAVRDALTGFRFKPTEVHGKRVPALAEMPFEFAIVR
jgi:TonB family protein